MMDWQKFKTALEANDTKTLETLTKDAPDFEQEGVTNDELKQQMLSFAPNVAAAIRMLKQYLRTLKNAKISKEGAEAPRDIHSQVVQRTKQETNKTKQTK